MDLVVASTPELSEGDLATRGGARQGDNTGDLGSATRIMITQLVPLLCVAIACPEHFLSAQGVQWSQPHVTVRRRK